MADPLTEALESAFAAHAQAAQGIAAPGVGYVPTTFGPSNIPAQYVRGLGEGAKNLLTGPGDIASGVREEGDWAPSMALNMLGVGTPRAMLGGANELGIFGGKAARNANLPDLDLAKAMQDAGHSPAQIYDATKWFQGADKQWRFEIPDTGAKVQPLVRGSAPMEDVLSHPALYENYPELRGMKTETNGDISGNGAYMTPASSDERIVFGGNPGQEDIVLHELQHAVQNRENFSQGTNLARLRPVVEQFAQKYSVDPTDLAHEVYLRTMGETEARNVEQRYLAGSYDRYPWETQEYPNEQQIPSLFDIKKQESLSLRPRNINAFGGDTTSVLDKAYGTGVMNPKSFDIVNELQQPVGRVWTAQHRPDQVLINYITGLDKEGRADWAPNSLGPSEMRSLLSSFKEQFPEAEKIGGYRISGARDKAGKTGPAYATLPAASAGLAGLSAGGLFFDENGNMKVAR